MKVLRRRAAAVAATALLALAAWARLGPLPEGLLDLEPRLSTQVVDRGGEVLYEAPSAQGTRGQALSVEDLPRHVVNATLAAEDSRFFSHPGVDPLAIVRATWHNLRALRLVEGGSTLTQQTAKLLIGRKRTLPDKLREMLIALRLEHRLTKPQILALYLSIAPYGNQLVGVEAASRAYFGCPAGQLTPAQAALLAALPQRPTALDPYRRPGAARPRQQWVIDRMEELGYLPAGEAQQARAERLRITRSARAFLAPHFVERVFAALPATGPAPRRVETTLDAELQRTVQGILATRREGLRAHGAQNVAVGVLDNQSGEWLAWEGSGDWFDREDGGTIDGMVTPRQPGSALKPFTYALAFERGFTPATVLPDIPSHFPTAQEGILYSPRNYDGQFRGPLRARLALAGSENVPAVWVLSQTGVPDLLRLLRRAGLTTLDRSADYYGYALTMGDAEVRLDELIAGYAAFARGGLTLRPRLLRALETAEGLGTAAPEPAGERLVSPRSAFWIADILSDPHARAWAFGRGGSLELPFPVAVKTGTSQSFHDNWTVGFTREVTVGVWVGNFDRQPLRNSSGVMGAAPIFRDVMLAAMERLGGGLPGGEAATLPERPGGLEPRVICSTSGLLAGEACPNVETEWMPGDRAPVGCLWHRRLRGRAVTVWPAKYRAWAQENGLGDRLADGMEATLPAASVAPAAARTPAAALRIVNPPDGATYLRDPTLRAEFQTLPLRAVSPSRRATLSWTVDGRAVGNALADRALDWRLSTGAHTVAVRDETGREATATIVVR